MNLPTHGRTTRYRGVDRRTPLPLTEAPNIWRLLLVTGGASVVPFTAVLSSTSLVSVLLYARVLAGVFAVLAAVALFIRWRLDGRAQSWWLDRKSVV